MYWGKRDKEADMQRQREIWRKGHTQRLWDRFIEERERYRDTHRERQAENERDTERMSMYWGRGSVLWAFWWRWGYEVRLFSFLISSAEWIWFWPPLPFSLFRFFHSLHFPLLPLSFHSVDATVDIAYSFREACHCYAPHTHHPPPVRGKRHCGGGVLSISWIF